MSDMLTYDELESLKGRWRLYLTGNRQWYYQNDPVPYTLGEDFDRLFKHIDAQAAEVERLKRVVSNSIEARVDALIRGECEQAFQKFGDFNSAHELYAVLKEELDEFWESVRHNKPDAWELVQVAAVARRGVIQMTASSEGGA